MKKAITAAASATKSRKYTLPSILAKPVKPPVKPEKSIFKQFNNLNTLNLGAKVKISQFLSDHYKNESNNVKEIFLQNLEQLYGHIEPHDVALSARTQTSLDNKLVASDLAVEELATNNPSYLNDLVRYAFFAKSAQNFNINGYKEATLYQKKQIISGLENPQSDDESSNDGSSSPIIF